MKEHRLQAGPNSASSALRDSANDIAPRGRLAPMFDGGTQKRVPRSSVSNSLKQSLLVAVHMKVKSSMCLSIVYS